MGRLQREEAAFLVTTASPDRHRIDEMAIALRRAAHDADVELARIPHSGKPRWPGAGQQLENGGAEPEGLIPAI